MYRAEEQLLVLCAGDVLVNAAADTLRVSHLGKDPAVGGGDALDSAIREVGVVDGVHGGVAVEVYILGGYLTVFGKLLDEFGRCNKSALAVGDRDHVDIAGLVIHHPGGLVGANSGRYQLGLVAADAVEGEGGSVCIRLGYLAEGNETQLDKCLEAVADAYHKTVTVVEKIVYGVADPGIAEECGDELAGAVRLVAA